MEKLPLSHYLKKISQQLLPTYKDHYLAEQYAWLLLQKLLNKTKTELIISLELPITSEQSDELNSWIFVLTQKKMPIQYLLGSVQCGDLEILVKPPTLIPRPETEEWVMNIIDRLKQLKNQHLRILDLATGSGCIALLFAHYLPHAHITATDISSAALLLAQKNSAHNSIKNVTFIESDLFTAIPQTAAYDMIVSNPPYIAESERTNLDASVVQWEDEHALFAADNGLFLIKKIINEAPLHIKQNDEMKKHNIPQIMIEIGHTQANLVKNYMSAAHYNYVHTYKDTHMIDRVVAGRVDDVADSSAQ